MTATRWVTATALTALAEQRLMAGDMFTAAQLGQWTAGALTAEQRVHATTKLCGLAFVRHQMRQLHDGQQDQYTVTADGAAAITAAAAGHARKSGPKTTRKGNPPDPKAFTSRLWHLMRIRKVLTPREAAETLCDAGDDDFARRWATARKCLRRWTNAGALAESARRVGATGTSNGDKRYVLVKDSPKPPTWHRPKHAASVATTHEGPES